MKKIPAWLTLEKVIAEIERQLAPGAIVKHDDHIDGRSKALVKFDVTVRQQISHCDVVVGIECKREKRRVGSQAVREFGAKVLDAGISKGVIISGSGFTEDARTVAAHEHVQLMTYRQATDADWKRVIGEQAWIPLTWIELGDPQCFVILDGMRDPTVVPPTTIVFQSSGEPVETIVAVRDRLWSELQYDSPLGTIEFGLEASGLYVRNDTDGQLLPLAALHFTGRVLATRYLVDVTMGEGHVLEEDGGPKRVTRMATSGFDWNDIRQTQSGHPLNAEEFTEFQHLAKAGKTLGFDPKTTKRFVRLVVAHQDQGSRPRGR